LEYGIKLIIGHNELQEAQMLSETWSTTLRLFYGETYMARSPSR
jgi:hypothetical protein